MSSKTVWGTLAIVVLAAGAGAACSSGSVVPGVVGNDPNSAVPNGSGVPGDSNGVPTEGAGADGQGGGGTNSGRRLINTLSPCEDEAESCSDAELDSYASCATSSCDTQLRTCYGDSYQSGTFGGTCGELLNCVTACGCNDNECQKNCKDKVSNDASKACVACLSEAASCMKSACAEPSCFQDDDQETSEPKDSGTSTTPTGTACAELSACCATLDASIQSQCNSLASSGSDDQCKSAIDALRGQQLCP